MHSKTFIHQLHAILSESHLQEWIRWSTEDDTVFVLKPYDVGFSKMVLKRYFKHGNVSSFVRQLHMYGFHKITTAPENSVGTRSGNNAKDRSNTIWSFQHPQGNFRKGADVTTLKKIQRKSTGVGKDGKRKNMLSTVCINYVGSANQEVPLSETAKNDRRHYASLPLLPPAGPVLQKQQQQQQQQQQQYEQPLLPHLHRKEHLIAISRAISLPEIVQRPTAGTVGSSTASPAPAPVAGQQHHPRCSSPLYSTNAFQYPPTFSRASGPLGSYTTPNSSVVSSNSTAVYMMNDYHQRLENNLKTLRNSLVTVADVLPSLCSDLSKEPSSEKELKHSFDHYMTTLQNAKEELIADKNWLNIRSSQALASGGSLAAGFQGNVRANEKTFTQSKEANFQCESQSNIKTAAQDFDKDVLDPGSTPAPHPDRYDRIDSTSPIPKP